MRYLSMLVVAMLCLVGTASSALAQGEAGVALELVAENMTAPVQLQAAPDGSGQLFVVDQIGLVWIVTPEGERLETPFLDVREKLVKLNDGYDERGLLGLAFHPDYEENGRFFIYYSAPLREGAPNEWNHTSHLAEYQVMAEDPLRADPTSERILMRIDQPQMNHNGGTLAFGPEDNYLYLSLGDGGGANDTGLGHVSDWFEDNEGGNGQDITENLLGSILRIDVDGDEPYGIPADNPFVGRDGMDEIYAYGFRNPYRFSFDMGGEHALIVGDAGQDLWEEVDVVEMGGNYGWNLKEATHCFAPESPLDPPAQCPDEDAEGDPLIDPVIEFLNSARPDGKGLVVVAGHVYRGDALPDMAGRYLFGAWSTSHESPQGRLFVSDPNGSGLWGMSDLPVADDPEGDLGHYLLAMGQDRQGEVYVLTSDNAGPTGNTGQLYRLVPPSDPANESAPASAETSAEAAPDASTPATLPATGGQGVPWLSLAAMGLALFLFGVALAVRPAHD